MWFNNESIKERHLPEAPRFSVLAVVPPKLQPPPAFSWYFLPFLNRGNCLLHSFHQSTKLLRPPKASLGDRHDPPAPFQRQTYFVLHFSLSSDVQDYIIYIYPLFIAAAAILRPQLLGCHSDWMHTAMLFQQVFWAVWGTLLSKSTSDRFHLHPDRPRPTMNVLSIIFELLKMETLNPKVKLKHGKQWKSDRNRVAMMRTFQCLFLLLNFNYAISATPALAVIKVCQQWSSTEAALPQHFHHLDLSFIVLFLCCLPVFRATDKQCLCSTLSPD